MRRRFCVRWVPGFTWVQFAFLWRWRWGHYWAVSKIVRAHNLGPLWVCTMRKDCVERARAMDANA